jgi:hypothetical protein
VTQRKNVSVDQSNSISEKPVDQGRRHAIKSIARFSAYVAPTTFVLIDSKSAFAQTCSGAQSELDILQATSGGSNKERLRRLRQIRQLRQWLLQNGC